MHALITDVENYLCAKDASGFLMDQMHLSRHSHKTSVFSSFTYGAHSRLECATKLLKRSWYSCDVMKEQTIPL